jgi:DNA-binding transcriptional regulator YdaS (Cro superfamily)
MEPSKQTLQNCIAACELAKASVGGAKILAKKLGISRQAVTQWQIIPIDRVKEVERASGISRRVLRPDYFADDEAEDKEAAA